MSRVAVRHTASRQPRPVRTLTASVAAGILLVGCGVGERSQPTTDVDDGPSADEASEPVLEAVTVEGPGFAVQLPVDSSWRTVGLHDGDADDRSGALLSEGAGTALVLVWQPGQQAPGEALDRAFSGLAARGIDVVPAEPAEVGIARDLDVAAQHVTLESSTGSTHGLAAVWTCEHPERTFALMVHDGGEQDHLAVADLAVSGFDCNGT